MTRPGLSLTALLCLVTTAMTSPARSNDTRTLGRELPPSVVRAISPEIFKSASGTGQKEEFRITYETEIVLDGRPCKYRDVPSNAVILKMEVGTDKKTVLKIHFRTQN